MDQDDVPEVDTVESLARKVRADIEKFNASLRSADRLTGWCCDGGPQWGHAWNCPTLP